VLARYLSIHLKVYLKTISDDTHGSNDLQNHMDDITKSPSGHLKFSKVELCIYLSFIFKYNFLASKLITKEK
jgi:hypothetical protein